MPTCSLIVRAFNEEEHIGKLLAGVMEQTLDHVEVILVDSGSTDATVAIASRFPTKIVTIAPETFTFGRSLNIGCEHASGDILVMASAHVFPVYPDWLERLVAPFEDPEVAAAYGRQKGDGGTKFSEEQIFAKLYPPVATHPQDHPFCNNANAAIRRELWGQRKYDEDLPGLEDLEWAIWAVGQGKRVVYVPEAEVVHVHNESPRQVYNRYRREAIGLKMIRPQERFHLWDFGWLVVSNILSDVWHAIRAGRLSGVWRGILWFRLMQFWGTYRGFVHRGPVGSRLKQAFYYPRGLSERLASQGRAVDPIDYASAMESSANEAERARS